MSEEEDERLARELQNSSEDGDNDEILARDLQLALQLQAQEEQNHQVAQKRRSKRNHHHHPSNSQITNSICPGCCKACRDAKPVDGSLSARCLEG